MTFDDRLTISIILVIFSLAWVIFGYFDNKHKD